MTRAGVAVSIALWAALPLGAQRPETRNDEAAVREVVRLYVEAREARDAGAIAALFTEDADQLTSAGEWRRGREALVQGAQASSAGTEGK
ncbi:MAG TPA: SgcJ/EcaC family oxidoreductase, partial [Vicinamibacteria bacterium]|nr:SgcJ/EcaC family oxidoreductase [Vicinamibacteria bacterium]